jgi:hypothetical protein
MIQKYQLKLRMYQRYHLYLKFLRFVMILKYLQKQLMYQMYHLYLLYLKF